MNPTVATYIAYLLVAVPLTFWVARTLRRGGRRFLVDVFGGNTELADSVNHLLVVGFYLLNLGFVALFLRLDRDVPDLRGAIEAASWKLGFVMLVLGGMHLLNVWIFHQMRRRALLAAAGPPERPTGRVARTAPQVP